MKAMVLAAAALVVAGAALAEEPSEARTARDVFSEHKIIRCAPNGREIYFAFKIGPDRELTPVQVGEKAEINSFETGTVYLQPDRVMVLSKHQLTIVEDGKTTLAECDELGIWFHLLVSTLSEADD